MARFGFEAVDGGGRKERGVIAGVGAAAVEAELEGRGLLPLRIDELDDVAAGLRGFGMRGELLEASRSIGALLNAGLPLARCLSLTEAHVGPRVGAALAEARSAVERGQSFASALDPQPGLFPPLYRGLVRAGERSGDLAGAYERLVQHLEREEETRGRIASASIYPLVLVSFGGVSLLAILLWVVPRFASLVTDAGATLPPTASLLVGLSGVLRQYGWVVVGASAAILGLLLALTLAPDGRKALGRVVLGAPVIGGLRREVLASRFARMLGTLLQGGAPVLSALTDVEESVADAALRESAAAARLRVREGERLAAALQATGFFPDLLVRLVGIGEDAGRLPEFALKAADILDRRAEQRVRRLVALFEPTVIVVFGGLIAVVAISLLQAIYSVNAGGF